MLQMIPLYVQILGNLLFCAVFLFVWRQSAIVYFGYWSLAWGVESAALLCLYLARRNNSTFWSTLHALLEFGFALSLLAAARLGSERKKSNFLLSMRVLILFPGFLLALWMLGWNEQYRYEPLHALVLSVIYGYSFYALRIRREDGIGLGRGLFQFTLLGLAILFLHDSAAFFYVQLHGFVPGWMGYLNYVHLYDFALQTLLAFSALALWIEDQNGYITRLSNELDSARRESAAHVDLDHLTGLMNQAALARSMGDPAGFAGVAAVCDMDDFKSINDRYGHLVGDEILRNVGNLLKTSVRAEDTAFRWGGDEFVVLFRNQNMDVARSRMEAIEERLRAFRVRGHGVVPITFSWGIAECGDGRLRESIDLADQQMYQWKRARKAGRVQ